MTALLDDGDDAELIIAAAVVKSTARRGGPRSVKDLPARSA
jgi:hypothetical protein